jgi:hypothetical protein
LAADSTSPNAGTPWPQAKKTDFRQFAQFLKAIAEISTRHPTQTSVNWFAVQLKKRAEYAKVSDRTLRREVVKALDWVTSAFGGVSSSELLPETKRHFRQDALFVLRTELAKKKLAKNS